VTLRSLASQTLAPLATIVLLGGMYAQSMDAGGGVNAERYHAAAREAIEGVPERFGDWRGTDVEVPQSAVALLKPNALLGRRYVEEGTGRWANLVIVQCRDTRDMSGHYPPVCYPAHGWTAREGARTHETVTVAGLEATTYEFMRTEFDRAVRIVIYAFFVVPGEASVGWRRTTSGVSSARPRSRS